MSLSIIASLRKTLGVKPHPAGLPFIAGSAVLTVLLFIFAHGWGFVPLILTAFCLYFFRNPERVTPQKSGLVISPADGMISAIVQNVPLPAEIGDGETARFTRVSIFLSVLDVHVNRAPVSGFVVRKAYCPGKFFNADLDKASEHNERCSVLLRTAADQTVGMTQIAGLIARRIVNDLSDGQAVVAGGRFGIIRFGSRVDIYLPNGTAPLVCVGQRAIGGETVLADFSGHETAPVGSVVA